MHLEMLLSSQISHATVNRTKNVSHSKAIVEISSIFRIQPVVFKLYVYSLKYMYAQMAYSKQAVMCVWSHNSVIISHIQL